MIYRTSEAGRHIGTFAPLIVGIDPDVQHTVLVGSPDCSRFSRKIVARLHRALQEARAPKRSFISTREGSLSFAGFLCASSVPDVEGRVGYPFFWGVVANGSFRQHFGATAVDAIRLVQRRIASQFGSGDAFAIADKIQQSYSAERSHTQFLALIEECDELARLLELRSNRLFPKALPILSRSSIQKNLAKVGRSDTEKSDNAIFLVAMKYWDTLGFPPFARLVFDEGGSVTECYVGRQRLS